MILSLGQPEADSILQEHDVIEVGCDFCGLQYRFDAVDTVQIFRAPRLPVPPSPLQ
jgi:molecular chaperone Hsp33